ncbi:hypothetical protein ASD32_25485 [Rhizobium sp. Root483D2]|nr:hypothetical protein ASD32_25485 [Rhizobium sp. Root483D2]
MSDLKTKGALTSEAITESGNVSANSARLYDLKAVISKIHSRLRWLARKSPDLVVGGLVLTMTNTAEDEFSF